MWCFVMLMTTLWEQKYYSSFTSYSNIVMWWMLSLFFRLLFIHVRQRNFEIICNPQCCVMANFPSSNSCTIEGKYSNISGQEHHCQLVDLTLNMKINLAADTLLPIKGRRGVITYCTFGTSVR